MRWRTARPATLALVTLLAACVENIGPRPVSWAMVAAGDQFTCALDSDGAAWCWGLGSFGQLGNNLTVTEPAPARVSGGHVFRTLAAGNNHVCGIGTDGIVWCWGFDDYGELGGLTSYCNNNIRFIHCSRVPVAVGGGVALDSIVVAAYTTCGIAQDGAAWCWGLNDHGQLGTGGALASSVSAPALVLGNHQYQAITLDVNHACARAADGVLWCWGSNDFGQLAVDTVLTPRCGGAAFFCATSPLVAAAGLGVSVVSAGSTHTCGLVPSGDAYCWGSNEYGVLGNPAASGGPSPVRVLSAVAFTRLSSGADHTCALDATGAAWCWGIDTHGQLGVASPANACPAFGSVRVCATSPVQVEGAPMFAAISAGSGHSCGLAPGGEIWCWGRGDEGQLGDGQSTSTAMPVRVAHP